MFSLIVPVNIYDYVTWGAFLCKLLTGSAYENSSLPVSLLIADLLSDVPMLIAISVRQPHVAFQTYVTSWTR